MESVRNKLRLFLAVFVVITAMGSIGFMIIEDLPMIDAVYFSIVTIATVGYGDIHPATSAGKVLAIVLIISGVGTFLGVVANATEMLMNRRENDIRKQKLHMVVGVFFSEIGTRLIVIFSGFDSRKSSLARSLDVNSQWTPERFSNACRTVGSCEHGLRVQPADLQELKNFLTQKTDVLLRLLENPILLEHEAFTELLRAVFHLKEELGSRDDLIRLPETDISHLVNDMVRVYGALIIQWLNYMKYLKDTYPYLFSHAVRTNPFDPTASPVVE